MTQIKCLLLDIKEASIPKESQKIYGNTKKSNAESLFLRYYYIRSFVLLIVLILSNVVRLKICSIIGDIPTNGMMHVLLLFILTFCT